MNIDEIVSLAWSLKAQVHKPALVHLYKMAQAAPDGTAVEIGVFKGGTFAGLCLAREGRGGELLGVDDWSYPEPPELKNHALNALEKAGVSAQLVGMTSAEASKWIDGPLVFVFIDANHAYDYVKQDIELWTPKVMKSGIVAFHDYGRNRADIQVKKAVDEWQARDPWQPLGEVLTVIGFRKP